MEWLGTQHIDCMGPEIHLVLVRWRTGQTGCAWVLVAPSWPCVHMRALAGMNLDVLHRQRASQSRTGGCPCTWQPSTMQATVWCSSCWLHILRCGMGAGCTKLGLYALGEVTTAWVLDISVGHRRVLCIRCHARCIMDA